MPEDVDKMMTMTMMKGATTTSQSAADLATLLQSCMDHLQTNEELTILSSSSSVYLSTMMALQNHAFQQFSHLQTNIAKLEEQQRTLEISCRGKRDELAALEATVTSKQKEWESSLHRKTTYTNNDKEVGPHNMPQPANNKESSSTPQKAPSAAPVHAIKSSNNAKLASSSSTTAQRINSDKLPVSPNNKPVTNNANSKAVVPSTKESSSLTPLELQKKAAMEKRRQQVLEERRKAAEEQRRRKEDEHQKFLEYEQRKEELKIQAQKEAAATRRKAREQAEKDEIEGRRRQAHQLHAALGATTSPTDAASSSDHHPKPGASPLYTTPMVPSSSKGPEPTPSPPVPSTNTTSRQTSGASIASGTRSSHNSQSTTMRIPNLPTHIPQNSSVPMSSTTAPPPHTPTGTDTKYSQMVGSSSSPTPIRPTPLTAMLEPSQETMTALKHNVLLHWALVPPHYQVLKPIPHLLCQIHTVFPPCFGVVAHEYFAGFEPISWPDLVLPSTTAAANQAQMVSSWDPSKVKKAVRTIRFFLHPDKLPRDLDGLQQFLCKLLWDIVNDANEDYLKSLQT